MKKASALLVYLAFLLVLTGCNRQDQKTANQSQSAAQSGKDLFPDFLVGRWDANEFDWNFKFEKDGTISSLRHIIGVAIDVNEGMYYEEAEDGRIAVYILGPYEASYNPKNRRLNVKIVLEHFRLELPAGTIEGHCTDYFDGVVSKNGKTWDVKWRNYGWIEGGSPPDPNLIEANPAKLVFTKVKSK